MIYRTNSVFCDISSLMWMRQNANTNTDNVYMVQLGFNKNVFVNGRDCSLQGKYFIMQLTIIIYISCISRGKLSWEMSAKNIWVDGCHQLAGSLCQQLQRQNARQDGGASSLQDKETDIIPTIQKRDVGLVQGTCCSVYFLLRLENTFRTCED